MIYCDAKREAEKSQVHFVFFLYDFCGISRAMTQNMSLISVCVQNATSKTQNGGHLFRLQSCTTSTEDRKQPNIASSP